MIYEFSENKKCRLVTLQLPWLIFSLLPILFYFCYFFSVELNICFIAFLPPLSLFYFHNSCFYFCFWSFCFHSGFSFTISVYFFFSFIYSHLYLRFYCVMSLSVPSIAFFYCISSRLFFALVFCSIFTGYYCFLCYLSASVPLLNLNLRLLFSYYCLFSCASSFFVCCFFFQFSFCFLFLPFTTLISICFLCQFMFPKGF